MSIASIIKRNANQTAVYWGDVTPSGSGGFEYGTPVEISCIWVESTEIVRGLLKSKDAENLASHTQVYVLESVTLNEGDLIGLTFTGWASANPLEEKDVFRIIKVEKIPNFKGRIKFKKGFL